MVNARTRDHIRRRYRSWRALANLTQIEVEVAARRIYPEFGIRRYPRIETGQYFPTPSERKALARVLKVDESELPVEPAAEQKAVA